jgi:CBS domain-containing protein
VDWLAHNRPVEGERAEPPTAGRLARDDVVRVAPDDRGGEVVSAIEASPYSFALVSSADGMLLGRVRASELKDAAGGQAVGEIMELDPSTVRPHRGAGELAEQLAEQDLRWAIVTTPEGRLIGVAWREDLERAAAADP